MDLSSHRFFSHFPPDPAAKLVAHATRRRFGAGEMLFDEGTAPDAIVLVLAGEVELLKRSRGESFQLLATAVAGEYFGELGVLDGSVRSARAVARGPVEVGWLPAAPFISALGDCPWETVMHFFRQVNDRLRATNTNLVAERLRKEKIALIGEMANNLLHDFRNPVTTIELALAVVTQRHDDERTIKACDTIQRQLRLMRVMVEEVLEFARGTGKLNLVTQSPARLLREVASLQGPLLSHAGIKLSHATETGLRFPYDFDRMLRVFQNLVGNAADVLAGTEGAAIRLEARRAGDRAEITVSDNGPGIPEAIRSTLFEPFVTHGKRGGTGLGLAIVRGIIESHGGTIEVASSGPDGTTFRILLPLRVPE